MSKKSVVLLIGLTLSTAVFAQPPSPKRLTRAVSVDTSAPIVRPNAVSSLTQGASVAATSTCSYTFTSGGTATLKYLQYCVTVNGNITEFQSPAGAEHIRVGTIGDGYALCDFTAGQVGYHDYADYGDTDTGPGWAAPVLLSQSATVVKIARTTADGRWTLTQTFTQSAADASVKVAMAITNNTAISRTIWLTRFTDIDADNTAANIMDGTAEQVFGYNTSETGYGLQISLAAPNTFSNDGLAINQVDNACAIGAGYTGLLNGVDGIAYSFHYIIVPAHGTKTVTLKYKGL